MHWIFFLITLVMSRSLFAVDLPVVVNVAIQDVNVKESLEKWQAFSDYLQAQYKLRPTLHIESESSKLESMVRAGGIDLVLDTLMPQIALNQSSQLVPTFVAWKSGVKVYQGCVVSRQDQDLSIQDLPGRVIGFEDPLSTASFALPLLNIIQSGHALEKLGYVSLSSLQRQQKFSSKKEALIKLRRDPGRIHYVFTGSDETSAHWLKRGYVDMVGMSCTSASKDKDLKIVMKSPSVPRAIVSLRRDLDSGIQQNLVAAFDAMSEGHPALEKLGKVSRITLLNATETASLNELTPLLRKILAKVQTDQNSPEKGHQ